MHYPSQYRNDCATHCATSNEIQNATANRMPTESHCANESEIVNQSWNENVTHVWLLIQTESEIHATWWATDFPSATENRIANDCPTRNVSHRCAIATNDAMLSDAIYLWLANRSVVPPIEIWIVVATDCDCPSRIAQRREICWWHARPNALIAT